MKGVYALLIATSVLLSCNQSKSNVEERIEALEQKLDQLD